MCEGRVNVQLPVHERGHFSLGQKSLALCSSFGKDFWYR